jgi:hypothetical protein
LLRMCRKCQRIYRSRMFGWDGNPLRRRSDRVEAVMVTGLIVVFLAAAPVLAVVTGHWTWAAGVRHRPAAAWRQVPATVQQGTSARRAGSAMSAGTVWVLARWMAPDGQRRSGLVAVSPAVAAGGSTRVWVNRAGSLTGPTPPACAAARLDCNCQSAGIHALAPPAGYAGQRLLGRRRLADWIRTWEAVGPQWNRQC